MKLAALVCLLALAGCGDSYVYTNGDWSDPTPEMQKTLDRLERGAASGDDGDAWLLVYLRDWNGGDRPLALENFRALAEDGNASAAHFMASYHSGDELGGEKNLAEAARWLRIAAENGSEEAAAQLAHYDAFLASDGSPEADSLRATSPASR